MITRKRLNILLSVVLVAAFFVLALPAAAQTDTPIPPTATNVSLMSIDTNLLMNQVNNWTMALDDVIFLGSAIAIAIAILTFIGASVLKAFSGNGLD